MAKDTGYLLGQAGKTRWEQADGHDVQRWMVQLLDQYSSAYASIQFRALRQFFKWLAAEDELPDPMARLRAPKVTTGTVPVFSSVELSQLEGTCRGSTFAQRRDAAIIAVFRATGIRLSEWDPADRSFRKTTRAASAESEVRPGPRLPTLRARHVKIREAAPEVFSTVSLPIRA